MSECKPFPGSIRLPKNASLDTFTEKMDGYNQGQQTGKPRIQVGRKSAGLPQPELAAMKSSLIT